MRDFSRAQQTITVRSFAVKATYHTTLPEEQKVASDYSASRALILVQLPRLLDK